ncbi:choice-of-anchor H family protein [Colwellia sp. 1_MG-2023]|uniref:choice-of-anchor H family protein n=1 Tax=unclassified Colwellia TaxID=196834 RepID=UPI001C09822B|nr:MULTISPECIES: choice-of-anchor H family protein [unclassified Colwellia]MBU2925620.1 choice-of-anchor H family protein [Colwellia sp. C2M11]MDO6651154.1 choice-of-anchor H family protein [Colwellia sp. 3_MG-2023]MDO6666448.1 choice-of-anchor H family protein [Colwellia sp. 2_MG-2023]MDO6690742.1 choice-of-anchor H family protein [Colwellia sp. 1_MG-2023]
MFNNTNSNHAIKLILLAFTSILFSTQAYSNEVNESALPSYSISQGSFKSNFTSELRQQVIDVSRLTNTPDQLNNKATSKTREEMLNNNSVLLNKASKDKVTQKRGSYYDADFTIYGVTSFLLDDFDNDGFYQTFSVVFDADMYSYTQHQRAEVYALLYLSKNGKPWKHYYTTDTFIIEADSDLDEYEVITTFLSGYPTDFYDVLIDLYQVGYTDIVATYSSDDSNALYALPLESDNHDDTYIEVVEVYGGGSFSFIVLFMIIALSFFRFSAKQ